jgi:hypothetical protein
LAPRLKIERPTEITGFSNDPPAGFRYNGQLLNISLTRINIIICAASKLINVEPFTVRSEPMIYIRQVGDTLKLQFQIN